MKNLLLASVLVVAGCGGGGGGGSDTGGSPSSQLVLNGDFERAFRNSISETVSHPYRTFGAALHWTMSTGAGNDPTPPTATMSSTLLPSEVPGGGGNMLRFYSTQGLTSTYIGGSLSQVFPATTRVRFECDLKVVAGAVMAGPIQSTGPFYSQQVYTPNGQWRHLVVDCPVSTESVGFQNVGGLNAVLEILVDNVRVYHY